MQSEKYRLQDFENLYGELVTVRNTDLGKFGQTLERLSKLLVYDDRNEGKFFKYFCQVRGLDFLLEVFGKAKAKESVIAIIGFFNLLWTNLSKPQTIHYLLSHPCILSLQNIKFVSLDNEIAQYYINFLKGLSRKLNPQTLHLFMNRKYPNFPLLMQTTRFYNHPEALVRTTCRNILLTCAKINDEKIGKFVDGFPFCVYYLHEANFLREYWSIIDRVLEMDGDKQFEVHNLDNLLQDHQEILLFIDDFMKINPPRIASRFIDAFANECMPILLESLFSSNHTHFSIKTSLFIIILLIKDITNPTFHQFLILCILGKYYSKDFNFKLLNPVEKPLSYCKQWKFKGFWDSHQNSVKQYCEKIYCPSEKSDLEGNQEKMQGIVQKYSNEVRSIFGMGTNFYERECQKIESIFAIPVISDSQSLKKKYAAASQILFEFQHNIINNQNEEKMDLQPNPVRPHIINSLKSKDDSLLMLNLTLLISVLQCPSIRPQQLQFCCLSTRPQNFDFSRVIDIQNILKNCLEILVIEPPVFRICTYKQCQKLINRLLPVYQMHKTPEEIYQLSKIALKKSIMRVEKYLFSGQQYEENIYLFYKVSFEDLKNFKLNLYTFGLLRRDEEERKKLQNHQLYEIFPSNQSQTVAHDFWIYIIARNIYCKLTGTQLKFDLFEEDPQKSQFEVGASYTINESHQVLASYKRQNAVNFEDCSLIFLGTSLVIGEKQKVKFKKGYEECMMVMDRSDPRKVILEIGKDIFIVEFSNSKSSYDVRRHFQDMKKTMYKKQLAVLVKQSEWLLSLINS